MRFSDRRWAVVGIGGFGSPVGLIGGGVQYTLFEALSAGAAVGTNSFGLQAAAYVNIRPLHWSGKKVAFGLGPQLALATGPYRWSDPFSGLVSHGGSSINDSNDSHHAHWAQVDLGLEVQSRSGFVFRFSHGAAWMLNPRQACHASGTGYSCDYGAAHDGDALFTTTITIGRAFGGG